MHSEPDPLLITPETRVGEMLKRYPNLEDVLMGISPTYQALKNPVLRKTVAKVATLRQVAKVGNVPLGSLMERLRSAVGQESAGARPDEAAEAVPRPAWADAAAVKQEFDAREMIESGGHPMPRVMSDLAGLGPEATYVLVTAFMPAPLIDLASQKGFEHWSECPNPLMFRTYFRRKQS